MIEPIWLFPSLQISTRLILTIEKEEEKDSNKRNKLKRKKRPSSNKTAIWTSLSKTIKVEIAGGKVNEPLTIIASSLEQEKINSGNC